MFSPALRFAVYYAAFYLVLGMYLPYFPAWLEGRGLTPEWIGILVASGLLGRTLVAPLGARWADTANRRRDPILILATLSLLLFIIHLPVFSPWILAVLAFLLGGAYFGQIPLADTFALRTATRLGFPFGPVRAFGSVFFILANFGAGAALGALGAEWILTLIIAGSIVLVLTSWTLPRGRRRRRGRVEDAQLTKVGRLLRGPFLWALLASGLIQSSHGFYYAMSVLAWTADGLPSVTIGALWATGVAAEILFLFCSGLPFLRRLSPGVLLMMGGAGGIVRWGLTALSPPLGVLFLLQALHAMTFAATFLGFMRYAAQEVPDDQAATAQAMNSALAGGGITGLVSAVSGLLYDGMGTAGYMVMIVPCFVGLLAGLRLRLLRSKP